MVVIRTWLGGIPFIHFFMAGWANKVLSNPNATDHEHAQAYVTKLATIYAQVWLSFTVLGALGWLYFTSSGDEYVKFSKKWQRMQMNIDRGQVPTAPVPTPAAPTPTPTPVAPAPVSTPAAPTPEQTTMADLEQQEKELEALEEELKSQET